MQLRTENVLLAHFSEMNVFLQFLREAIKAEDRIELELDRNVQVLSPAQANKRVELPDDFFAINKEEIKKEQMLRY